MLMLQGLLILSAGMGLVVLFLVTMIFVMKVSSVIVPKFNHLLPDPVAKKPVSAPVVSGCADIAVAIAVAAARGRA